MLKDLLFPLCAAGDEIGETPADEQPTPVDFRFQ